MQMIVREIQLFEPSMVLMLTTVLRHASRYEDVARLELVMAPRDQHSGRLTFWLSVYSSDGTCTRMECTQATKIGPVEFTRI